MPRLFHRPPKYRFHKTTKQRVVSLFGKHIYLGPYGSRKSHQRYQEILKQWEKARHDEWSPDAKPEDGPPKKLPKVVTLTPAMLREKRLAGSPVSISELIYVYRQYTKEYHSKNGEVNGNDCYTTAIYRRAIHRIYKKAGVDQWSPNQIRHTASTEIRKRCGIDAARTVDGRGSTTTTEIYAELDLQ
jgi:integrase